jgi:DNA-binding LytR/AlgR family response regulator
MPLLQLTGSFRDPVEALTFLKNHEVDLVFLDVNMPGLTGIQFLKSLRKKPLVIFTTAYSQYAVESYEHDAVDYLLKPIEFDRFCRAVTKAQELSVSVLAHTEREKGYLRLCGNVEEDSLSTTKAPRKKERNKVDLSPWCVRDFVAAHLNQLSGTMNRASSPYGKE